MVSISNTMNTVTEEGAKSRHADERWFVAAGALGYLYPGSHYSYSRVANDPINTALQYCTGSQHITPRDKRDMNTCVYSTEGSRDISSRY